MFNKKHKSISHYAFVSRIFSWTLYQTLLNKKIITRKDFLKTIDSAIQHFKSIGYAEQVGVLEQIRALEGENNADSFKERLQYARDIGML